MDSAFITSLHRFPVKSMWGEDLEEITVGPDGVVGDRVFAVVDRADGRVASAKHPRKWGRLLELRAAYTDMPGTAPERGVLGIEFPDGRTLAGDSPRLEGELERFVGRPVALASGAVAKCTSEAVWLDIDGAAPQAVIDSLSVGLTDDGGTLSEIPIGSAAGSFVDAAAVHVLTTSTLRALAALAPDSAFDRRRYRPNIVVDLPADGFAENDWVGRNLRLGASLALDVTVPTVRCVMTTLAQGNLPEDRNTLRTLARANRLDVPAFGGRWACAGVYANVAQAGTVRHGDAVRIGPTPN